MTVTDVVVVGGGPAGCAAAITLARAGREVLLADRARFPRDKCCGDGLTAGALRRLEALGLCPDAVPSWNAVDDVWVRSPSGRVVRFPLPLGAGTYAAVAPRRELDAALLDSARSAGVEVFDGHRVVDIRCGVDGIVAGIEGVGDVDARYLVAADGMWSPVRKMAGAAEPGYLGEWHAFRQYFSATGPLARRLWVWFDADLLPGYGWSFPLPDGRANVGFGVLRGAKIEIGAMKAVWADFLARPHVAEVLGPDAVPEAPHQAWPIPSNAGTSLTAGGGRVLFAGDAARVTDPMTGEGIGQALETGELAASAILRAGALDPALASRSYERAIERGIRVDNGLAAFLTRALRHRKGARTAVRVAGLTSWTRRNFARWLFEDYPRAVLATPRRWHHGMLTGPGAYR